MRPLSATRNDGPSVVADDQRLSIVLASWITCRPDDDPGATDVRESAPACARMCVDPPQSGSAISMIGAPEDFMAASELDAALDAQIERLVSELESQHSRAQIQRIVEQCAARYQDAQVTTFIPILVYHEARSLLSGRHTTTPQCPGDSHG
jgi:hypothetical protein